MAQEHLIKKQVVTGLLDAMKVRKLRNSCATFMTNVREPLSRWVQVRWYFKYYRAAVREGRYRIFLFCKGSEPVGYGALQLDGSDLLVTECVATNHRGRGVGTLILRDLIGIAQSEQKDLVAEIWTSNAASVGLHEKAGFVLENKIQQKGEDLSVYRLAPE